MLKVKTFKKYLSKIAIILFSLPFTYCYSGEYVQSSNVYIGGTPRFTFESTYNWNEKDQGGKSSFIDNPVKGFFITWGSFISESVRTELQIISSSFNTPEKLSISTQSYLVSAYYDIFSFLLLNLYAGVGGGVSYTNITDLGNLKGRYNITTQARVGVNINLPFNWFVDASYTYLTTPYRLQHQKFATQSFPLNFKISGPSISLYKSF